MSVFRKRGDDTTSKISATLKAIRAMEAGNQAGLRKAVARYDTLENLCSYSSAWEMQLNLRKLKDLALELSRQQLQEEILAFQQDINEEDEEANPRWISQRKNS